MLSSSYGNDYFVVILQENKSWKILCHIAAICKQIYVVTCIRQGEAGVYLHFLVRSYIQRLRNFRTS